MAEGAVVVDMAADPGGNCELTEAGRGDRRTAASVVVGLANPPSAMPTHASFLYARNVANFLALMVTEGELAPDWDDEIVAGMLRAARRAGRARRPTAELLGRRAARDGAGVIASCCSRRRRRRGRVERPASRVPHRLRPGRLRRLRGRLEGPEHPAHPAHVGLQRHPRRSILVGAMLVLGEAHGTAQLVLGFLAVVLAT